MPRPSRSILRNPASAQESLSHWQIWRPAIAAGWTGTRSTRPLVDLVPVQPAAMAGRQICQWDKDSCADAGFLKIDLLGLGMLSAVEDALDQIAPPRGGTIDP